ncbi:MULTISPECIES: diguanylate cyclase domain-containing protein [unclassified Colwellia]|uniref:sensor domain-containing diguanylate cyclase n=1 Tax=unclassified Colwellia TaxID=196834 RepID=UPI0015F37D64|nr:MULTISPECIES: diguanylate cyclase [unclassified Colwellia]MBA6379813.1 diguanylate cyclase [Colwellia sp. BRX10-7]MBA6386847.1 diguanylate cyclase [Colwellia sp. BRX10-2]MBA6401555.1 diguanylate cyclase [Colwellia sp. BRX10-5]MBA6405199.1 diguanylate cyclase [Colwellia sp. BRX10-1]
MKISQNLYVRVPLAIAIVAVLVALVSSTLSYYAGLQEKKDTNYLLVKQLAQTMAKTATISAYLNDRELGQEIISGLLSNDLVQGARLSGEGEMSISSGALNKPQDGIVIQLIHPFIDDTLVGTLTVYPDNNYIQQQVENSLKKEVALILIQSIIIAFFVSLIVHRWLTKPIQKLTDSFTTINPSIPKTMRMLLVKQGAKNEIGKLTKGINSLMHELHLTISNERALREKTQELERKFRLIFEQASAGICLLDEKNTITTFNPAFLQYFSVAGQTDLVSLHFPTLLNNVDKLEELLLSIRADKNRPQVTLDIECRIGNKTLWLHCLFAKLTEQRSNERSSDQGNLVEVIIHDVTERAEREFQTRFEADHDPLTHLLNRRSGDKKLDNALLYCLENQQSLVLMMIDLDKFKPVNDSYGHEAGDKVLIAIAKRLKAHFNLATDLCIRWGGDEFIVARQLTNFDQELMLEQANNILAEIEQPIHISDNMQCQVGASIGIVVAPKDAKVLHELMVKADDMMYQVKASGRGQVAFYQKP